MRERRRISIVYFEQNKLVIVAQITWISVGAYPSCAAGVCPMTTRCISVPFLCLHHLVDNLQKF